MRVPLGAELAKQVRQRGSLLWGFAAVPVFSTAVALALELAVPAGGGPLLGGATHPIRSAMRAVSIAGNPIAQLFYGIGAAAFFALEYRSMTWRLVVPRSSRAGLFAAKAIGFGLLALASLAFLLAGDLAASLVVPMLRHAGVSDVPPATVAHLLLAFATSAMELVALGGTAALLAVTTRSTLGTLLPVFLISFALAGAETLFNIGGDSLAAVPLPTFAADAVRSWIVASPDAPGASSASAAVAAFALVGWSVLTYGLAGFLFARQDLSKE